MSTIATVTELADLFGVDRRTVSGLAKRGIILRSGRGFDRDDSVRRYCAHLARAGDRPWWRGRHCRRHG